MTISFATKGVAVHRMVNSVLIEYFHSVWSMRVCSLRMNLCASSTTNIQSFGALYMCICRPFFSSYGLIKSGFHIFTFFRNVSITCCFVPPICFNLSMNVFRAVLMALTYSSFISVSRCSLVSELFRLVFHSDVVLIPVKKHALPRHFSHAINI